MFSDTLTFDKNLLLADLEEMLGKDLSSRKPNPEIEGVNTAGGESLIKNGFAISSEGKKTSKQSKHFKCISCHNVVKEDQDLSLPNPETRLSYALQKNIPFLQGSTLYGVINRITYFNGDYDKKFGEQILPARNDIRKAIQWCAVENAKGRRMKDWELESVIAYLWSIGIKTEDLELSDFEKLAIEQAAKGKDNKKKEQSLELLALKYANMSNATFIDPPENRKSGNGLTGEPINGSKIYKASCLYCHQNQNYSYLHLDDSKMSLKYLKRHLTTNHRQSIYHVVRLGVPSFKGKSSHMPLYSKERMSEQQLADLIAFISQ